MPKGLFISVEGPDGSGKSTLIRGLAGRFRRLRRKVKTTREPGGSPSAEAIREVLLSPRFKGMTPEAELLLFEAARRQHLAETVEPALRKGQVVLSDRFVDSTTAYQGAGRSVPSATVAWLNRFACQGRLPDLTLVLDLDPALGLRRAGKAKGRHDRMEKAGLEFHRRVRAGFLRLAKSNPRRIKVLKVAQKSPAQVLDEAWALVQARLKGKSR